jgi:DNA-binding winged helix-turn-helix (wHTH) protein
MICDRIKSILFEGSICRHLAKIMGEALASPISVSSTLEKDGSLHLCVTIGAQQALLKLHSKQSPQVSSSDLTYPLPLVTLLAAIKNALLKPSRAEFMNDQSFFDPMLGVLFSPSGEAIHLTERESDLLQRLYDVSPVIVSRDTLMHDVWGYASDTTTHTLETHIYRLRQKMEQAAVSASVETVEGGYRLIVRPLDQEKSND